VKERKGEEGREREVNKVESWLASLEEVQVRE